MTSPLSLILFDVDGTLVDSQAHIFGAMVSAFESQDLPVPPKSDVLSIVGLSLFEAFGVLRPDLDDAKRDALVAAYKNSFMSMRQDRTPSPLYPGARACLDQLGLIDEYLLGVATGKSRRGLDHVLRAHDLGGKFVTEQVADFHPSKPHPAMAQAALDASGAERGVMIGDTTYDMEMGRAAGLKTIAVTWGYHPVADLRPLADVVVDRFAELAPAIKHLWGNA
ncbi:MAG: HAD-IA family hydrolase [Planktomarina sp.]